MTKTERLFEKLCRLEEKEVAVGEVTVQPPSAEGGDWHVDTGSASGLGMSLQDALEDALGKYDAKAPSVPVVVNSRSKQVSGRHISFVEVVQLAYADTRKRNFTVTYRHGALTKPEGEMTIQDTVPLRAGMVFNVART